MASSTGKTLTVLGDSLSMVRIDEQIWANDLYPSRIMLQTGIPVYNRARRTNTTSDQCRWQNLYDDIKGTRSEYYVIQLGVCDCYPRLFRKWQQNILARLPEAIRNPIIGYRSSRRYEITRRSPHFFVPIAEFEHCYKQLLAEINGLPGDARRVALINIAYPSQANIERNYNLLPIIDSYNQIIHELADQPDSPGTTAHQVHRAAIRRCRELELARGNANHLRAHRHCRIGCRRRPARGRQSGADD